MLGMNWAEIRIREENKWEGEINANKAPFEFNESQERDIE